MKIREWEAWATIIFASLAMIVSIVGIVRGEPWWNQLLWQFIALAWVGSYLRKCKEFANEGKVEE